jgi:hypothetical protein
VVRDHPSVGAISSLVSTTLETRLVDSLVYPMGEAEPRVHRILTPASRSITTPAADTPETARATLTTRRRHRESSLGTQLGSPFQLSSVEPISQPQETLLLTTSVSWSSLAAEFANGWLTKMIKDRLLSKPALD